MLWTPPCIPRVETGPDYDGWHQGVCCVHMADAPRQAAFASRQDQGQHSRAVEHVWFSRQCPIGHADVNFGSCALSLLSIFGASYGSINDDLIVSGRGVPRCTHSFILRARTLMYKCESRHENRCI